MSLVDRGDWVALAIIAALGAYIRWQWTTDLPPILHQDSDSYFEIAQRLWNGHGFGDLSRRTPLYPLLLWLTGKPSGSGFYITLAVQHALGVATALLTYLTARGVLRYRVPSLFAGLMVAAAPVFVLTEHSILSESLYTFFLAAAGWLLSAFLRLQPQPSRAGERIAGDDGPVGARAVSQMEWRSARIYGMLCGVALGAACLTRPVGLAIGVVWLMAIPTLRGWRAGWHFASSAGFTCLLIMLPLLIRNQREVGSFSLTQSTGRNLISVTDLQVDYSAAEHKKFLSIYHGYLANKRGPDAVVVYSAMPAMRKEVNRGVDALERHPDVVVDRALAAAAWDSIARHPLDYLGARLQRLPLLFADPMQSLWYALHLETYVPLIEFTSRQNPEMTSRTVVDRPLKEIDFARPAAALERWRFPFGSAWFLMLAALGVAGGVVGVAMRDKIRSFASLKTASNGSVVLIFLAVAASLLTAILMQPPNLRYRTPTLLWEIVLAAAGLAVFADLASRATTVIGKKWNRDIPCWIPNVAMCVAAVGLFAATQAPATPSAIRVADFVDSANQPGAGPAIIRQMPLAGRQVPMIYWRADMPANRTISADAELSGGGAYWLRVAYSCGEAGCANGQMKLLSFGPLNTPLGTLEMPLARERTDNDLFWEQIDERVELPAGTDRVRMELSFDPGAGNLVIPFISLTK